MFNRLLFLAAFISLGACSVVPGTGDKSTDAAAAQQFVPASIPGYDTTDAASITDALTKVGAASSLLTGNIVSAGAIAKLNNMIACYQSVGAVASKVYVDKNIALNPNAPKVGVLAVINTTRIQRNLFSCVLNTGGAQAQAASNEIQPCGGSGEKVVNGETLNYVYAATTPELCATFQAQFN
ncbi:MAG: hypothetical protein GC179_17665 [Anaerolineaceae bacterium]|nr:hypothetical protein [Anaerolineaceae bacterium]